MPGLLIPAAQSPPRLPTSSPRCSSLSKVWAVVKLRWQAPDPRPVQIILTSGLILLTRGLRADSEEGVFALRPHRQRESHVAPGRRPAAAGQKLRLCGLHGEASLVPGLKIRYSAVRLGLLAACAQQPLSGLCARLMLKKLGGCLARILLTQMPALQDFLMC